MVLQVCPSCEGLGAIANAISGTPELCPNCEGEKKITTGFDCLPFWYPFDPPLLAANGTAAVTVAIDNDADFLWDRVISNSSIGTPSFTVFLFNNETGRAFMGDLPKPLVGGLGDARPLSQFISGSARQPFWLPKRYLLKRGTEINGIFTDTGNGNNRIQFCLVGQKIS
jgi:hypothetical protein